MKKLPLILFLINVLFSFSQQNFINVPSSEVTKKNKLFFQQQMNFGQEIIQSNTTFDFGLGKGFEAGINILDLNFNPVNKVFILSDSSDTRQNTPLIMLNGLKSFGLSENVFIACGTQIGLNYNGDKKNAEAALVYGNLQVKNLLIKQSNLVIGSYYNSLHYGGSGNKVGGWLGLEIPVNSKLHLMGESVIGNNAMSYTSLGIIYYPLKRLPLTFGFQIPNSKNNTYSFVFELTFVP